MRAKRLRSTTLIVGLWSALTGTLPAADVIHIGQRRELFVDNYLIERLEGGAELRLHRPTEREIVFTGDRPWEGNRCANGTFIQDGDTYRMYYRAADAKGLKPSHRDFVCLAESNDGVQWTRPVIGLVEFRGSKANNIVLSGEAANTFVPFKDANPDCSPDEQYKALALMSKPAKGLYAFTSPDGTHWRQKWSDPIMTKGKFDSQNLAFWDPIRNRYTAYYRQMRGPNDEVLHQGPQLGIDDNGPARDVMTCTSTDFQHWTEPQWLQYPDSPRMQIYYNQVRPYFRAPHLLVAFPGRYMGGREIEKGLPVTKHPSFPFGSMCETLFMTSRDGVTFRRWGEAFIRPGPRHERWIYPQSYTFYGLLETKARSAAMPNELSLYVLDGGYRNARGEATRFRRYTTRIDGFVSVQAPLSGGELLTRPFVFGTHDRSSPATSSTQLMLHMNFATSAAGSVRVEIQDKSGQPLAGFTLADSDEIFGDAIDRVVSFKSGGQVAELAGKPIRLRFVLQDADLYSFQFLGL